MLTIALSKGRLAEKAIMLLENAGYDCTAAKDESRKLILEDEKAGLRFIMAKPADVPTYVEYGAADIGFVGKDTLLEEGRELPAGLLLFSPWTDMTADAPSYETYKEVDPILSQQFVKSAAEVYINGAGDAADPRFSPLFGVLSGLPPVYIMAGRNEILLDDSVRLYDEITKAGGRAMLDIEESGWHVYQQTPVPIATRAMRRLSAYITGQVYGDNVWEVTTGTK